MNLSTLKYNLSQIFSSPKDVVGGIIMVFLIIAIPIAVLLVKGKFIFRSSAASPTAKILFSRPDLGSVAPEAKFTEDLILDTSANTKAVTITGVDVTVHFPTQYMQAIGFQPNKDTNGQPYFDTQLIPPGAGGGIDNNSGVGSIRYAAVQLGRDSNAQGYIDLGTITFQAKQATDSAMLNLDQNSNRTQVVGSGLTEPLTVDRQSQAKVAIGVASVTSPAISSISCTYAPDGTGTLVSIYGSNLGGHTQQGAGNVTANGEQSTILSWLSPTPTQTISQAPAETPDRNPWIQAKVADKLKGNIPVTLALDDGTTVSNANTHCSIDTTTISFVARPMCRSTDFSEDNVDVKIFDNTLKDYPNGVPNVVKPVDEEKISLDQTGSPTNYTPNLVVGTNYSLLITAPGSLTKRLDFQPSEGTNFIPDSNTPIALAQGDIAPIGFLDGKINSLDIDELFREWSTTSDVTRFGDFNGDSRVNSLDYECMRENYGKESDKFTVPTQ